MKSKQTTSGKSKGDILVLGVHDGHNAGAALILNGAVIAAINEERLNNIKNYSGVPALAIQKVFEIARLKPEDVTLIAVGCYLRVGNPLQVEKNPIHTVQELVAPHIHNTKIMKLAVKMLGKLRGRPGLYALFEKLDIRKKPIIFVEHHQTHAACAYYQRPWQDKSLILTLDGMGDGISATVSVGEGNNIKRISETSFYDSLSNNLYSEITGYLGLKRWEHEYKVMGLAPYGRSEYIIDELRDIIRINPKKPLEFENISGKYLKKLQPIYRKILAEKRFDNISAATQELHEQLVIEWVENAIRETNVNRVVCAGGSFLNVKANKLIRELPEVKGAFFYPAADDGGTPVGAALEGYYRYCKESKIKPRKTKLRDLYYGQEFTEEQISDFLKSKNIIKKAKRVSPKKIAKLLANGKIIARFSGRDEWGPRALGNRSIMADPRSLNNVRKINQAIKQRDFWMPFAASILSEDMERYLLNSKASPYMIEAFDTKPAARSFIAALHPQDLSARPQTVCKSWNPGWYAIIKEFKNETGVGAILNTSFNLHGYPIVGTPEAAYKTFMESNLDGLLFNERLILK
ncbi:hypothetical protein MUP46_02800 [Patescibacteria group bacterium]|nr:hypothetical protein [Patescibacteria group bacterium]